MRILLVILIAAFSAPAMCAAEDSHVLVLTSNGYVGVHADGSTFRYERIITLGTPPTKVPPPIPEPLPEPNELTARVKTLAAEVADPNGAQVLAFVYREAADAIDAGNLDAADASEVVRKASDLGLGLVGSVGKWNRFRSQVDDEAAALLQRAELLTPDQMKAFLADIGKGLQASVGSAPAVGEATMIRLAEYFISAIEAARDNQ